MPRALVWRGFSVALASLPVACSSEEGATGPVAPYLTMLTAEASYRAGDIAAVRLINHHHQPLSYYECDVILEVLTASGWRRAPMANLPCRSINAGIGARSEASTQMLLPDETATGMYRVRIVRIRVVGKYPSGEILVPDEQLSTNVFAVQ